MPNDTLVNILTHDDGHPTVPLRLGSYIVDGLRFRSQVTDLELYILPATCKGTVYEFLGDYYHGAKHLPQSDLMKKRYERTVKKMKDLLEMGYAVCYAT